MAHQGPVPSRLDGKSLMHFLIPSLKALGTCAWVVDSVHQFGFTKAWAANGDLGTRVARSQGAIGSLRGMQQKD